MPWSLSRVGPQLSKCEHGAVLTEDAEDLSRESRFKSPTLLPACMPLPGHVLPTANRTNTPQRPRARHRTESVAASAPVRPHYGLIRRGGTSSERLSYFPTLTQPRRASSTSPFPAPGHTAAKEDHSPLHYVTPGSPTSETFTFSPSR